MNVTTRQKPEHEARLIRESFIITLVVLVFGCVAGANFLDRASKDGKMPSFALTFPQTPQTIAALKAPASKTPRFENVDTMPVGSIATDAQRIVLDPCTGMKK